MLFRLPLPFPPKHSSYLKDPIIILNCYLRSITRYLNPTKKKQFLIGPFRLSDSNSNPILHRQLLQAEGHSTANPCTIRQNFKRIAPQKSVILPNNAKIERA